MLRLRQASSTFVATPTLRHLMVERELRLKSKALACVASEGSYDRVLQGFKQDAL